MRHTRSICTALSPGQTGVPQSMAGEISQSFSISVSQPSCSLGHDKQAGAQSACEIRAQNAPA
jgi:hypothetical protein